MYKHEVLPYEGAFGFCLMISEVLSSYFVNLPRRKRRVLTACIDFLLLATVVWLLTSGRYGTLYLPLSTIDGILLVAGPLITVVTLLLFRVYHGVARYIGPRGAWRLAHVRADELVDRSFDQPPPSSPVAMLVHGASVG